MFSFSLNDIHNYVDNIIRDIKSKEQLDPANIFCNNCDIIYMYKQLLQNKDNKYCKYYLALLLDYYPEPEKLTKDYQTLKIKYYQEAADAGHPGAMFRLGNIYYCNGEDDKITEKTNDGIGLGVKALEKGYDLNGEDQFACNSTYIINCFKRYTQILRNEVSLYQMEESEYKRKAKRLEKELEQERCRPPKKGGSDYEKCEQHFYTLTQE